MSRFKYWLIVKTEMLPIKTNAYLNELELKYKKTFCCMRFCLAFALFVIGIITVTLGGESWLAALIFIAGALCLIFAVYLGFTKCVVDDNSIEKRSIIPLKRVFWDKVDLIIYAKYTGEKRRIILVYGNGKLLLDFEYPMDGMQDIPDMARHKGITVKTSLNRQLHEIIRMVHIGCFTNPSARH